MSFYNDEELDEIGFLSIGSNVLVSRKSSIYGVARVALGDNVRIDDYCVLSAGEGGISIGCNVHVAIMTSLIGKERIEISDFCNISSRVSIYSSSDDYSGEYMTNPTVPELYTNVDSRPVVLGCHVIVGSGSIILPGVTIGDNVAIGALSLVNADLKPDGIYAGQPVTWRKKRSKGLKNLAREYLKSN